MRIDRDVLVRTGSREVHQSLFIGNCSTRLLKAVHLYQQQPDGDIQNKQESLVEPSVRQKLRS